MAKSTLAPSEEALFLSRSWYPDRPGSWQRLDSTTVWAVRHAFEHEAPRLPQSYEISLLYIRFRYKIDSVTIAFELRKPGAYVYEHIELLPYNTEIQQFLPTTRVANSFGDAGFIYEVQSLMRDMDGDGSLDLLQRKYESNLDVEADTVEFERDSLFLRLWVDSLYTWREPLQDTMLLRAFGSLRYE